MRQRVIGWFAVLAAAGLWAGPGRADTVEMKGVHLCCKQCVRLAEEVLGKVEGLSDVKVDSKTRSIAFAAKDAKTADAALSALATAGYAGTATRDQKEAKYLPATEAGKADELTVKDVHLCCGACKGAVTKMFPDAKVEFPGKNEFKLTGKGLDRATVLETLRKGGFNGTIAK